MFLVSEPEHDGCLLCCQGGSGQTYAYASLESAAKGVRVNSVGPGYIDTPLLSALDASMRQVLINLQPIGRLGRPDEIANAVLFLLSDEASFVIGANLLVEGGFTAGKS